MTDIERAIAGLEGHTLCLCGDGEIITDDGRGISPMMRRLSQGENLAGYSAADVIVGKAAAMLFDKAGIVSVYGKVMSVAAKEYLEKRNVPVQYGKLTDKIINRAGDGDCPMEAAVADIDNAEDGYRALTLRLRQMRRPIGKGANDV